MRIVKEVNKGPIKMTLFHMNNKYSLKIEKLHNELIMKFSDGSILDKDGQGIDIFFSDEAVSYYEAQLDALQTFKVKNLAKIEEDKGFVFPTII
jgi:hypothetical protein